MLKRFDGLLETVSSREELGTIPVRVSLLREVRAALASRLTRSPRAAGAPSDTEMMDFLLSGWCVLSYRDTEMESRREIADAMRDCATRLPPAAPPPERAP